MEPAAVPAWEAQERSAPHASGADHPVSTRAIPVRPNDCVDRLVLGLTVDKAGKKIFGLSAET